MSAPPLIFDHALIAKRRARAARMADDGADFLLRRAAEDLRERLATVLRPFPAIADIATPAPHFLNVLKEMRPESRFVAGGFADSSPEALDPALQELDLVTSGLALQFANDLPGVLLQIRRALRPDGLFLGCLLGGATLTELRQALAAAETETRGGVSPRVAPFADVRDLGGLLQRAGFALPVADSETVTVRYPDMFALVRDLRAMGGQAALAARDPRTPPRLLFPRAAAIYAERFSDADGRIRATFEFVWVSGWAPDASQQRPLKPGSARMRLADALRGAEPDV